MEAGWPVESSLLVLNTLLKWLSLFGGHLRVVSYGCDLGRFAHGMHHTPHMVGYLATETPGVYFVEYYGRLLPSRVLSISLRLSISRDISPPDAPFRSGIRSLVLLNRHRKATLSIP